MSHSFSVNPNSIFFDSLINFLCNFLKIKPFFKLYFFLFSDFFLFDLLKIDNNLLLSDIINFPNVYEEKKTIETSSNKKILISAVKGALKDLSNFRSTEGKNIKNDINKKWFQYYNHSQKLFTYL